MKPIRPLPSFLVALLATGCQTSIDPAQYQSLDCAGLNKAIAETAQQIRATAISRANIDSNGVPFWVLGADRINQQRIERNEREMSELRSLQNDIAAERKRRCS